MSTPSFCRIVSIIASAVLFGPSLFADSKDYSKEAFVIENVDTKVSFDPDGAKSWSETVSIHLQSEAAVRQFGVLGFNYSAGSEDLKLDYVRVKKADGSVIETPDSSIQDVASQVDASAPMYTDVRQKQVPVKALGVGDTLQYSVHSLQAQPETPGQFWFAKSFPTDGVALEESLEIKVPKGKYVQISSPKLKWDTRDEGVVRVYTWRTSQLEPTKTDSRKAASDDDVPKVEITSFRSWEEVGDWWRSLATPQAEVTPAIAQKAKELTAGLSSDQAKEEAIYEYVALKFRYISISLGVGKYRPHSAAEVLSNQYGDCKDKHTLLSALLKAAGIRAWPALIGAGIKFDASVPSPAQFNHVITVVPAGDNFVWLDTTAEVAPFGFLEQTIRDEQALMIPQSGPPRLIKTPLDPPLASATNLRFKGSIGEDGTLTGHFDLEATGDSALGIRAGFHQLAPAQWQALAQQISYALGYAGEVSAVAVDNVEKIEKPLRFSYDYTRKEYPNWKDRKITMPLPPIGFGPGNEVEKPKEPFWAGAPGVSTYRASVTIPKGFSIEMPSDTTVKSSFAEYSATYSYKDGGLESERRMTIKESKVKPEQWTEYQTFNKAIRDDEAKTASLSEISPGGTILQRPNDAPETSSLLAQADQAIRAHRNDEATALLKQAESAIPDQPGLWAMRSYLESAAGHRDAAIADARKEVELHPREIPAYQQLAAILVNSRQSTQAVAALRSGLSVAPESPELALAASRLLSEAKQYAEIPPLLEKPIAAAPQRYDLQVANAVALLRSGHKSEGLSQAHKVTANTSQAELLNDLAYALSDTDTGLDLARDLATRAVDEAERQCARFDLDTLQPKDLGSTNLLAAAWDTLGWTYFKQNDLAAAERYVRAAWNLGQRGEVGAHLGDIYEKTGRHAEAILSWQLAAAGNRNEEARQQLRKAGLPDSGPIQLHERGSKVGVSAAQRLGELRNVKLTGLSRTSGSSELFLVLSRNGVEDLRFVQGNAPMDDAVAPIRSAKVDLQFPDSGPEKVVRRAIVYCSEHTNPNCSLTFVPLYSTQLSPVIPAPSGSAVTSETVATQPPTLLAKVEPEYTKTATDAHIEGTVLLNVIIDEKGLPDKVSLVQSLGYGLDEQAVQCVSKWRFNPATRAGKPVSSEAHVQVNFRLLKNAQ